MPKEPAQSESTYVIDAESAAEMTRLIHQNRLMTKNMGGLFPTSFDLSNCHDILDIACGPGGWVMDVAFTYPKVWVTGIDVSNLMIEYARAQAKVQGLNNARFTVMNATQPLQFPDNAFDIVNARLIVAFMPRETWPALVQECMRILRPGGILRLTDLECFITNKPSSEKLLRMITLATHRSGRGFSPDGATFCITPMLEGFLREAGFQNIEQQPHAANFSAGTEYYEGFYQDLVIGFGLVEPLLLKMGVTTLEEYKEAYNLAQAEMMQSDFHGILHFLSVWGRKPA